MGFCICSNSALTAPRRGLKLFLSRSDTEAVDSAEKLHVSLKLKANSGRGGGLVILRGEERRWWEMATQVEALLPGNPLAQAKEHGKVIRSEPKEEASGRGDGAKRQTGVADQGSGGGGSSSPGQGGTTGSEEQTSKRATEESKGGCDSEDKLSEEGVKGGGGNKKDFTEAPPPKVNPWTRKMNAVTVVSVNGQAHHGLYPPYVLIYWLSVLCLVSACTGVVVLLAQGESWG